MTDREEVIRRLVEARGYFRIGADVPDYGTITCEIYRKWAEAIDGALAVLNRQGPVKAEDEHEEMGLWISECGECHNAIRKPWHYCPFCGREIMWDD